VMPLMDAVSWSASPHKNTRLFL